MWLNKIVGQLQFENGVFCVSLMEENSSFFLCQSKADIYRDVTSPLSLRNKDFSGLLQQNNSAKKCALMKMVRRNDLKRKKVSHLFPNIIKLSYFLS